MFGRLRTTLGRLKRLPPMECVKFEIPQIPWNRFIQEVCFRDKEELSEIQKNAYLCFWYDAEVGNNGHEGYFDHYPEVESDELIAALEAVAHPALVDNFCRALHEGEMDDYVYVDKLYCEIRPSLIDCLMEYVEKYENEILK